MQWEVQAMVDQVHKQWLLSPEETRPEGTWVRSYAELGEEGVIRNFRELPLRVWFIDHSGVHARTVSSFARFQAVVLEQRWRSMSAVVGLPEQVLGKHYEIGLTAFGPLRGTPDWYLEFQWGQLYGAGYQYSLNHIDKSISRVARLWVS